MSTIVWVLILNIIWDVSDVSDFKNYLSIITEIDDAIEKLKQVYKVDIIQFSDKSNTLITI
jgi:hypothetical protein